MRAACWLDRISIHSPRMGRDRSRLPSLQRMMNFNPLSPHGERHVLPGKQRVSLLFQSTLPAWGETVFARFASLIGNRFQSTLPAWGETRKRLLHATGQTVFQSTLPAWGETRREVDGQRPARISIHSPRMGRDPKYSIQRLYVTDFNPLSPHGERLADKQAQCALFVFQSTLPAWGETMQRRERQLEHIISIHSPRMGRDGHGQVSAGHGGRISIHSPRMGRDPFGKMLYPVYQISIHSPRMGRDRWLWPGSISMSYFNPLSPHGERPRRWRYRRYGPDFNPLSPHGERPKKF